MIQKIYGVKDLKDWTVSIRSRNLSMRVSFTGGANTARGIIPATYSTSDPVKQAIIEKSDYFKNGRIFVVQNIEVPDDAEAIARNKRNEKLAMRSNAAPSAKASGTVATVASNPDVDGPDTATVKVSDKAEAVEWLKEHYPEKGYTSLKLRGKEAFENACKECNVEFLF